MRVSLAALAAVGFGVAAPVHAQTPAKIDDIQLNQTGDTVSILVKLSQQPTAATARSADGSLVVEIDGLELSKLMLDPPQGSLVRHVEASGRKLSLSGAAFEAASTVIYRNAVLIEARLAAPKSTGSSLMATAPASTSAAPTRRSAPAAVAAVAPPPAPVAPKPAAIEKPVEPEKPIAPVVAVNALDTDKAIDLTKPRPVPAAAKESKPASVKPKTSAAALASIGAERCLAAATDVQKDPWSIPALGDHALCLIDEGKIKEAGSRLEQLAAFAPEDWRIALGRGALAAETGDASNAEIGYRAAASLAPNETIRAAISGKLKASHADTP